MATQDAATTGNPSKQRRNSSEIAPWPPAKTRERISHLETALLLAWWAENKPITTRLNNVLVSTETAQEMRKNIRDVYSDCQANGACAYNKFRLNKFRFITLEG